MTQFLFETYKTILAGLACSHPICKIGFQEDELSWF